MLHLLNWAERYKLCRLSQHHNSAKCQRMWKAARNKAVSNVGQVLQVSIRELQDLDGLCLSTLRASQIWPRFSSRKSAPLNGTEGVDLSDRVLNETDFPQFIGEVSANLEKELSGESKEEDTNSCLRSMLLLVANVLATLQATGRPTIFIQNFLNE